VCAQNEIYFSLSSSTVLPAAQIVSRCTVTSALQHSAESKSSLAWAVSPRKLSSAATPTSFYCRLAVDSRRGLFYEFSWEAHRESALAEHEVAWGSGDAWTVDVEHETQTAPSTPARPSPRKKQKLRTVIEETIERDTDGGSEDEYQAPRDETELPTVSRARAPYESLFTETEDLSQTPTKKRKRLTASTPKRQPRIAAGAPSTPRRPRPVKTRTLVQPTPHSKAALRARTKARRLTVRPVQYPHHALTNEADLPEDPWLRAMQVLHVAARPEALPCREEEYGRVLRAVAELLEEGSGGCVCEWLCGGGRYFWRAGDWEEGYCVCDCARVEADGGFGPWDMSYLTPSVEVEPCVRVFH
jgi:origin recognition complex subunit 1